MLKPLMGRSRLDQTLVDRGLAATRARARTLIMSGHVRIGEHPAIKPSMLINEQAPITLRESPRYVSRGGTKLEHALHVFGLDVQGCCAADIGASTGGFTDCLLQHGALNVYAIDVGYGQLDYKLRNDARVAVMERVNARYHISLPQEVDVATIDVSFISLELVVPPVVKLLRPGGSIVALIKPQFEVGKGQVGKGGVVRSTEQHLDVLSRLIGWSIEHGLQLMNLTASPLLGDAGNREFFLHLRKPS